MMNSDNLIDPAERDRITGIIARENGVAIGKDDPILIILTLHAVLVRQLENSQSEVLDRFSSKIEDISDQWKNDATKKAEKIISSSLSATNTAFKTRLEEATRIAVSEITAAGKSNSAQTIEAIKTIRQSQYIVLASAGVTLLAAFIVLLSRVF